MERKGLMKVELTPRFIPPKGADAGLGDITRALAIEPKLLVSVELLPIPGSLPVYLLYGNG